MTLYGQTLAPLHTDQVFNPNHFADLVSAVSKKVYQLQKKLKFDAIAGCGHSGLPLIGAVAAKRRMPFFAVRKTRDTDNDSRLANGFLIDDKVTKYLIIDDLISSGATINRIVNHITKASTHMTIDMRPILMSEPVGVLTYTNPSCHTFILEDGRKLPTFHIR